MKKVIKPFQSEQAKYYCDKHPNKEVFSELNWQFWYGSQYDLDLITVHLCDECAKKLREQLKKNFGITPKMQLI